MSLLILIEQVLRDEARALTAWEIVAKVQKRAPNALLGRTPHKTVNARISEDLKFRGAESPFSRVSASQFALREWNIPEIAVKERSIAPVDEEIAVVPKRKFLSLISPSNSPLSKVAFQELFDAAEPMRRLDAEETPDYIQLISSFVILRTNKILSFRRTKRLPEQRLHGAVSLNFGGHIEFEDAPTLFRGDTDVIENMLLRELYEELKFTPNKFTMDYIGTLYLEGNDFERQHAGIVFVVQLGPRISIDSREPGYHTDIKFLPFEYLIKEASLFDSWSKTLAVEVMNGYK